MTDSSPNALARASSSYLRSAMHQPIRWHEFGQEAFAAARLANKPMLLDIGAVWCHWCHVMDRESYDDAEVAAIVNEHYIAVKVDRDERPDIDSRYQAAVGALTGQGGWPLTAFLTPDGKPFYGGTYFPPADAYGRPSFKRVLLSIAQAYREKHGEVLEQAQLIESAISRAESFSGGGGKVSATVLDAIVESARKMFDEVNGGFGAAPKFPHPAALDLVMDQYVRSGSSDVRPENQELRTIFVHTLEKMARGGVYDQLAGGFHRYSVDERWIVPHFEKMCYDNSELLKNGRVLCWMQLRRRCMRRDCCVRRRTWIRRFMRAGTRCACRLIWKRPRCWIWRRRATLHCVRWIDCLPRDGTRSAG